MIVFLVLVWGSKLRVTSPCTVRLCWDLSRRTQAGLGEIFCLSNLFSSWCGFVRTRRKKNKVKITLCQALLDKDENTLGSTFEIFVGGF